MFLTQLQKFVNNPNITLSTSDFNKLLIQLKQKYNELDINNNDIRIEINFTNKTLKINYNGGKEPSIYQFKGNCPYFNYGKEYYAHFYKHFENFIHLTDYINIQKQSINYNSPMKNNNIISLLNNENIDYLEHIIKKHFEKVNLRNKVNQMKTNNTRMFRFN